MRTAGLPTFTKLYGRNDNDDMVPGTYRIIIGLSEFRRFCLVSSILPFLDFPVLPYKGTKSIVISTVSWIGGKNPFLGWAYVATAALFVLLAIAGTARHLLKPRFVVIVVYCAIDLMFASDGWETCLCFRGIDDTYDIINAPVRLSLYLIFQQSLRGTIYSIFLNPIPSHCMMVWPELSCLVWNFAFVRCSATQIAVLQYIRGFKLNEN